MNKLYPAFAAAALAVIASPAVAGSLTVRVVDAAGRPVSDAIVVIRPVGRPAPQPRPVGGIAVAQKDLMFHPLVSLVPVGSSVSFPNFDQTRHHVYSFSAAKKFELKLFARQQSRSVLFDKPGVVAVGCNIHDQMSAFLFVTDSAWSAKSGGNGEAAIGGLPAGPVSVTVWQPYLRAPGNSVSQTLRLNGGGQALTMPVRVRAPAPMIMNGY